MKCNKCNKTNNSDNNFCTYCGNQIKKENLTLEELNVQYRNIKEDLRELKEQITTISGSKSINKYPNSIVSTMDNREKSFRLPNIEQYLGGNWLVRIGIFALILGVGFFLQHAFSNNWINHQSQIATGILISFVLIFFGDFFAKRYPIYSFALSGGGVAVLYLTIFIGSTVYEIINSPYISMLMLVLTSAISVRLSFLRSSQTLAVLGLIGALLAPLLIYDSQILSEVSGITFSEPEDSNLLVYYLFVISLSVLVISFFKDWRFFRILSILGSYQLLGTWNELYKDNISMINSFSFLTVNFFMHFLITIGYFIRKNVIPKIWEYSTISLNPLIYLLITNNLLKTDNSSWLGIIILCIGLLYFIFAYASYIRSHYEITLSSMLIGVGLICIFSAIPVQLSGSIVTILFSIQALVLLWLSIRLKSWELQTFSFSIFLVVIFRLLFIDFSNFELGDYQIIFNERFLVFFVVILCLIISSYFYYLEINKFQLYSKNIFFKFTEKNIQTLKTNLSIKNLFILSLIFTNFLIVWSISFEITSVFDSNIFELDSDTKSYAKGLGLTIFWGMYASILLVIGISKRSYQIRSAAIFLLGIPVVKLFIYDTFNLEQIYRIISYVFLGILLIIGGFIYQKYEDRIKEFILKD
ncbi:MAG: hypothetical protein CL774_03895 [Chloroflexi bacterium]|nr:hypothetical protein [Chloroflexota bacterium]|tara:strand:+ start:1621 stop:3543 length:1923 start_codon:yes stop_codon:yes gene_type:complete